MTSGAAATGVPATAPAKADYRTELLPSGAAVASAARATGRAARVTRIDFKAAKRFSLAALRWPDGSERLAGRMRAQRTDGSWTPWSDLESGQLGDGITEGTAEARAARKRTGAVRPQGSTEPTWTGPARRLQVEFAGPRPARLRASFVDVSGSVPVARAARAATRQTDMAGINPRSAWDPNNECAPRSDPAIGSVQAVTVHHTAGSNAYTQEQVPAVMLAICKYHRNSNGWNDVGYNVLVDQFGGAWEGRAGGLTNAVIGAHAQGFNAVAAGISMIGDFTGVAPTPATVATVARVAAWRLAVAGVPRTGTVDLTSAGGSLSRFGGGKVATLPRVMGHRDVGQTACPGTLAYPVLDGVRASVAAASPVIPASLPAVPAPAPAPKPTPTPAPVKITISTTRRLAVGASAVVTGTAKQGSAPLKSAPLALQVGEGTKWQTVSTARTNSAGKYRFARKFTRSWGMRVIRTAGGGASAAVKMVVVPKLTLTVPKRMRLNRRVVLRGTIAPGRGPVTLLVERQAKNRKWVAGNPQNVRLKGRTLTVAVTPHSIALYRFRLRYAGSDLAAPARSTLRYGRVVANTSSGGGASVE